VLAELRAWILEGRLKPGDQVLSDAIAEELGVSRVPVREALRILEGEGQVIYYPHQGYFLAKLSLEELVEVYRIRTLLEQEAIREAVPKMTQTDFDRLAEAMADMDRAGAGDAMEHMAANRRFHFAILEPSGMPHLIRLISMLWDATDPYRSLYFNDADNLERSAEEHQAIVDAIQAGDVEQTVELLDRHRAHTIDSLHEILARSEDVGADEAPASAEASAAS
jgi:DNA-binding GntR family transcriptional regulator